MHTHPTPDLDGALLVLGAFILLALAGVMWIEHKLKQRAERERRMVLDAIGAEAYMEPTRADFPRLPNAEAKFWDDLRSGPCRLTPKEIARKAEKLAQIRTGSTEIVAFRTAKQEIERHVGRAL